MPFFFAAEEGSEVEAEEIGEEEMTGEAGRQMPMSGSLLGPEVGLETAIGRNQCATIETGNAISTLQGAMMISGKSKRNEKIASKESSNPTAPTLPVVRQLLSLHVRLPRLQSVESIRIAISKILKTTETCCQDIDQEPRDLTLIYECRQSTGIRKEEIHGLEVQETIDMSTQQHLLLRKLLLSQLSDHYRNEQPLSAKLLQQKQSRLATSPHP